MLLSVSLSPPPPLSLPPPPPPPFSFSLPRISTVLCFVLLNCVRIVALYWFNERNNDFYVDHLQSFGEGFLYIIILFCLSVCLFVCLDGWLVGWLVGWLTRWLVGWLAVWLVGWLVVRSYVCLLVCFAMISQIRFVVLCYCWLQLSVSFG